MIFSLGIDSGSTMCKAALVSNGEIIDCMSLASGWNTKETAIKLRDEILSKNKLEIKDCKIVSTGYGRENIDFADKSITEITAHGLGGLFLAPDIDGIVDIGGQDSKIIEVENGRLVNFVMNDKCAAGTGRFLEMACRKLEIPMEAIDDFIDTEDFVTINSMCAVFAESEIIGHLAASKDRAEILNGVIHSIGSRLISMMGKTSTNKTSKFLMTGGLSQSKEVVKSIEKSIGCKLTSHRLSPYAGAIGAGISIK